MCIYTYVFIGGGGERSDVDRATSQLAGRLVNDKTDAHTRLIDLLTRTGIIIDIFLYLRLFGWSLWKCIEN
jgi:hypothetical protein